MAFREKILLSPSRKRQIYQGFIKLSTRTRGILQEIVDISGDGDEIFQGFIKIKRADTWHFARNSCYLSVMVARRGEGS